VLITGNIFYKQKRQREEDVAGKQSQQLILEVEGGKSAQSFGTMM
jgi:hypothetical protein